MRTVLKLVQVSYLPVVVAPGPNPPRMLAKPLQMVASGLLEASGCIGYVLEWSKLFDSQPLTVLVVIHDLHELVPIIAPLSAIESGDLAGVKHPTIWIRSLFQPEGVNSMVIHWVLTGNPSSLFRSSGGGPVSPCSGVRSQFLVTSTLSRLWSPSSGHTLTLASTGSSFSLSDWGSKPHLLRRVYCLLVWGGLSHLMTP